MFKFKKVFIFTYCCKSKKLIHFKTINFIFVKNILIWHRILAIDFGKKRTGIAVTDELQIIASGLTTVKTDEVILFLKDYVSKEKVDLFLVGEPKQMDNTA